MANVLWSAWFDDVLPNVPGCPQALATLHIRAAAIDFCQRTLAWRVDMDPQTAIPHEGTYEFDVDSGMVVVRAMAMRFNGKPIDPKGPGELAELYADWPAEEGTPLFWTQENPSESFILVPKPRAVLVNAIQAKLAVKPSQTSTGIDALIFERYREAIAHGALARLFAMKKKPWTDGTLAAFHAGEFDGQAASANLEASRGYTGAPKRTRSRFF